MMPSEAPIGFFDSGLGGLSILKTAQALMPNENICYLGDTAHAPYGVRQPDDILALTRAGARRLLEEGVKALVIACNTATGVALEILKKDLPIPVFGVQPALEAAHKLRGKGNILALATPATFKTARYAGLLKVHGEHVISLPCPGLMEFVERGELSGPGLEAFLDTLFAPLKGRQIDVVVLGCTHYPFLWEAIGPRFPGALAVDDGPRVSLELKESLREKDLLSPSAGPGKVTLFSTGGSGAIDKMKALL